MGRAGESVIGAYLHDLFGNRSAREAFVDAAYGSRARPAGAADRPSPYERAADLVSAVDLGAVGIEDA
jgi:adenosylcobyric acid synthase